MILFYFPWFTIKRLCNRRSFNARVLAYLSYNRLYNMTVRKNNKRYVFVYHDLSTKVAFCMVIVHRNCPDALLSCFWAFNSFLVANTIHSFLVLHGLIQFVFIILNHYLWQNKNSGQKEFLQLFCSVTELQTYPCPVRSFSQR